MKKLLVLVLLAVMILSPSESLAARKKTKRAPATQPSAPAGINSLPGTWSASGTGAGLYARQPGENVALQTNNVVFIIEGIKFYESSGEGTADIIFKCEIRDNRNNVRHTRSWEYALPYDVKREGNNTWTFSSEFLDGEDKITLTLTSGRTAKLRLQGSDWDENFPDEVSAFDLTCDASKK